MRSSGAAAGVLQYSLAGPPPPPPSSSLTLLFNPNVVFVKSDILSITSTSTSSSDKSATTGTSYVCVGKRPPPSPPPPPRRRRRFSTKLMVSTCSSTLSPPIINIMMMSAVAGSTSSSSSSSSRVEPQPQPKSRSRRLILLRHAQSSWDKPSLCDHERPLSKSGEADAAKLSLKLQRLGWIPQLILSSDAVRSRETLQIMQKHTPPFSDAQVFFIPSFYSVAAMDGQTAHHLQHTICTYSSDDILTIMCMGHNRGWEEAASMFAGASIELKTCNAALLQATGNSWAEAFASAGLGGWKLLGVVKPNGI